LTDEQISQKLGSASADEAGMLAAMEFLEEQTNLREEDNRATEQWLQKMRESEDPRAFVAIQNFERAKQGLEPLPLDQQPVGQEIGSAEENAEVFEEQALESFEPEASPSIESTQESQIDQEPAEKPVTGYRLVSAANWIIGIGVFVPIVGAVSAYLMGMNFTTSVLAGLVGILVGIKVNVLGLITARRTHRGLAVSSRATFGVFGSILPGLILAFAGMFALAAVAFGFATYLDGRVQGLDTPFATPLVTLGASANLSVTGLVAVLTVVLAGILAIFGGRISRIIKITLATGILGAFLFVAISTTSRIEFTSLVRVFDFDKFIIGAPLFALLVSVFAYGVDGESISIASWGATKKRLTWPIFIFGFILPLLSYSHVAALLSATAAGSKTSVVTTIDFFLATGEQVGGTVMLYLSVISVVGLLFAGLMKLIEAIKMLGVNHIGYGSAWMLVSSFSALVLGQALMVADPIGFNLTLAAIALIPSAAWVGAVLTETVMRRGKFHDASLTRSYGFYGSVNPVAMIVFVISSVVGFGISAPVGFATWFGFLSSSFGISVAMPLAGLGSLALSALLTLASGFPRIIRQQRETRAVEERRYDLVDVVVD